MSGIGSEPPPPAPQTSPTARAAIQAVQVISNPPKAIRQIPVTTNLTAEVITRLPPTAIAASQTVTVNITTPDGPVPIKLSMNLPLRTQLSLKVINQENGQTTLKLISIDGKPLFAGITTGGQAISRSDPAFGNAAPADGTPGGVSGGVNLTQSKSSALATIKPGSTIIATVIGTNRPLVSALPPKTNDMPTVLQADKNPVATPTIATGITPKLTGLSEKADRPTVAGLAQPTNDTKGANITQQTGSAFSQIGLVVKGLTIASGGNAITHIPTPVNSVKALSIGDTLSGVITGTNQQGIPVVQTRAGLIGLMGHAALPRGTEIIFEVTKLINEPGTPPNESLHQVMQVGIKERFLQWRQWPSVGETAQALAQTTPELATQFAAIIPKPDNQLAANLLLFLGVLKTGDIRTWIGDHSLRLMQQNRPDVINRLSDEVKLASTIADEPRGEWRVHLIPFFNGEEIEKIRFMTRHHPEDEEESPEAKDQGQRFIIDIDLEKLGRMQLDGLLKPKLNAMDLIIRTDHPLPRPMQTDIQSIYVEANSVTGITGAVTFQARPANFIEIPARDKTPTRGGVVV